MNLRDSRIGNKDSLPVQLQQPVGSLETREITINSGADIFTTKTAPLAAELITITPEVVGKKRCRITWNTQGYSYVQSATSDIPLAAICVATINAGDDLTALARLAYVDKGVGDHTADARKRMLSESNTMIEWDLTGTDGTIDRIDIGAYAPTDTGTIPVYLSVEIW